MLWDLVYNSNVNLPGVSLGIEGVNTSSVNSFKYAFVTVPSNQISKFSPNSVCVLRLKNLTGGNYWGNQTLRDVATSIKELPNRHFPNYFLGGVSQHLEELVMQNPDYLCSFLNLEW